jgi:peptidoglycan-N-acetylglucosamine deacetylase
VTRMRRYAEGARWHLQGLPWWRAYPPRRVKDLHPRRSGGDHPVALTFDDGPDPTYTPQVLDVLDGLGVKATFFMCGLAAERHPQLVRAVAREGHTIGGHTWHHVGVRGMSPATWEAEVDRTHGLLEELTGRPIRYFRPPWCEYDPATIERLRARNLVPVLFSASGRDWETTEPGKIVESISEGLQPGAIVLLHDACGDVLRTDGEPPSGTVRDRSATVSALPMLVARIRAAGLSCSALPS